MPLLSEVVLVLAEREISYRRLTEQKDATTHGGKLVFHGFGALAEFERNLIRERIHAGLAATRRPPGGKTGETSQRADDANTRHALPVKSHKALRRSPDESSA